MKKVFAIVKINIILILVATVFFATGFAICNGHRILDAESIESMAMDCLQDDKDATSFIEQVLLGEEISGISFKNEEIYYSEEKDIAVLFCDVTANEQEFSCRISMTKMPILGKFFYENAYITKSEEVISDAGGVIQSDARAFDYQYKLNNEKIEITSKKLNSNFFYDISLLIVCMVTITLMSLRKSAKKD